MAIVFHSRQYCRFIEIKNNLKRKKYHRTNQDSNFITDNFINIDCERATI